MPLEVESPSATDECHVEQVKSVLEHMHSISCTAVATEVGISSASVYHFLINSLGKRNVCGQCIQLVLNADQRAMRVHLSTIHLQHWRNEGNAFLDCILTVDETWMHSFDPHLKRQDAEWLCPNITKEENCMVQSGCSEMDLCLTIPCQLVQWSMANITVHSCRIR
jgi:hypothetical protein